MASNEDTKSPELEAIDMGLPEAEFLNKAKDLIGELKKTERKTLEKETFIKVFKYMGDFNKLKTRELKAKA